MDRLGAAGEGSGVDRLGGVAQTAASAGNQCGKLVTAFLRPGLGKTSAGKNVSRTYGPRPHDVIASSRKGGVMAEEAPPARGVVGTGMYCFLHYICAE